jgi:hypothetical protein
VTRVAVVGDDILAVALARQLAVGPASVVLHRPAHAEQPTGSGLAALRLLHADIRRMARESAALRCWEALEEETGIDVLSPLHAIDVGPPDTIAALLRAARPVAAAGVLYPAEAARQWPAIHFDGFVAYQPAACRISVAPARQALLSSAVSWGVHVNGGRAARVRTGPLGDVQVLVDTTWLTYDAAIVVADAAARSELTALPNEPRTATVLSVEPIGPALHWPSLVHHPGLPPDSDGHSPPGCRADVNGGMVDLTLLADGSDQDPTARLWEYATHWLPGTIAGTKRVRTESRVAPRLDTTLGRLAVTSPLPCADAGLAPVVAAELSRDLFAAVDLDEAVTRAS